MDALHVGADHQRRELIAGTTWFGQVKPAWDYRDLMDASTCYLAAWQWRMRVPGQGERRPEAAEGRCPTRDEAMAQAEAWVRARLGLAHGA